MQAILDDLNEKHPKRTIFAKLSFTFGFLTLFLIIAFLISFPDRIKLSEGMPGYITQLIIAIQISCLLGLLCSIISLIRKERLKYIKFIGVSLNFLILIILIGLAISARVVN